MKDINFAWPLYYGLIFLAMAIGAFFWFIKKVFEGQFMPSLLAAMAILGLIGWVFVKIAYANKEVDEEDDATEA